MNEEKTIKADAVPYIAFESVQARNERHFKRLWIIILVLIGALIASNFTWIWYLFGADFEAYEVTADSNSNANYIGGDMDGDFNYGGENKSTEDNAEDGRTG